MKRCGLLQAQKAAAQLLLAVTLWTMPHTGVPAAVPSGPVEPVNTTRTPSGVHLSMVSGVSRSRCRRAISPKGITALLDYHNLVRSQVVPPAADMEYMLWDEGLAKLASSWASHCVWDHGPTHVMKYVGQNLSVTSGRYQSITELIQSWYQERHHFSYPNRCTGSACSHYTQMVWASSRRVGCVVRKCSNMNVFGSTWREATLLVCNYSVKGNWVGEAPYKTGKPCSGCPSSFGGHCWKNQCSLKPKSRSLKTLKQLSV